jgi:hypothetical protein
VHDHRTGQCADHGGELRLDVGRLQRRQLAEAAGGGQGALEDGGQRGLVELDDDLGPGHPPADGRHVLRHALGQRLGEVAPGAAVDDRPLAAQPLQTGGERERARGLHLERPGPALGGVVQRVEVAGEELPRPSHVDPGARDEPPAGRGEVDGEVDEQRRGAPDQIRPGTSGRQLRQVRQAGQLTEDGAHRVGGVAAGQRADAGGRSPDHEAPRMVPWPSTRSPRSGSGS